MDSLIFHKYPLFPPLSTTTRHYTPPKPPPYSTHKPPPGPTLTCRALGNTENNDNGSVFGVFGSKTDETNSSLENSDSFKTVDAEITPETVAFFTSDAEGDPDCPSDGYSAIQEAVSVIRQGKFVIVVDDENGDIEGNIVFAASFATPQTTGFVMRHGSGIVSVGMTSEDLERLNLPLMSPENENNSFAPSFTITVDAIDTLTGVSASDRTKTILALDSRT